MFVIMPAGAMARLRALAAASAAGPAATPPPPARVWRDRRAASPSTVAPAEAHSPALNPVPTTRGKVHSSLKGRQQPGTVGGTGTKQARADPYPGQAGGAGDKLAQSVRQLLNSGRPVVAAHLLQEEWALSARCLQDPALSKELIVQLVTSVNTAAALEVLPMVSSSADLCAAAIRAMGQQRSLKGVRAMLEHARDTGAAAGVEGREVWRAAIVAFGALQRPKAARHAFVEMRAAGAWTVDDTATVNLLLNALHWDISVQFIRCNQLRKEGVVPDSSTFNCLLKACMKTRDVQRAELAMKWMREDGVQPDEITYNTLIKIFSYSGQFDSVLGIWKQMEGAGFAPTPRLWGSLLMACSAAGQMEQAAIFWWEMKQLHSQGAGGVLTTDNVCGMMTACNDAGQYERALSVFADAKTLRVPLDTRAYNIALRACHTPGKTMRQEQLLQAFTTYDELKRSRLTPDAFTFSTLFTLCTAARQGHCALQLYEEMRQLGVQENVVAMTALLKALGSTPGMSDECNRLFKRMCYGPARVKPNHATFRTVIAALREQGELAAALRVYQGMRRLYPADNSEFEGLTAVAAERALNAEDADLRSAVAAVCGITSCREVDLHGMSVLEARAAVLCILAMLQQQYRDSGAIAHDVTIITGRGLGSQGREPVVRHEVVRLLEALFLPPLLEPGANAGRIVIPQQQLCEAMAKKMEMRRAQQKLRLPPPQSPLHLRPHYQQQRRQRQERGRSIDRGSRCTSPAP